MDKTDEITPYKYSPLVASFFSILSRFPENRAACIWHFLNLSFLILSLRIAFRLAVYANGIQPSSLQASAFICFLSVLGVAPAILHCLNSGQVGLSILFFYMLGVSSAFHKKNSLSAFFFALSAMFKFLPVMIVPYLWFAGKKRIAGLFLFWFFAFHLMSALWFGWSKNLNYLSEFLPFLSSTTLDHISLVDFKNQSAWAYLYRLIFYDLGIFEIRNHPEWLVLSGATLFLILYAIILFSRSKNKSRAFIFDCSLLAILIVMFNPNAWKHNFVLFLFPYTILLLEASRGNWKSWRAAALVVIAGLFLASNRDLLGWNIRFELMSVSVLFLASLVLFTSLVFCKAKFRISQ